MKRLEQMKETLVACVENQLCNLSQVNTQELGAAVDMIKDLEEAIYYCTITKAMNEPQHKGMMMPQEQHHQQEPKYMNGDGRMYRAYYGNDKMYNSSSSSSNYNGTMPMYMNGMKDPKEGRSPMYRAMYMTSKEINGADSSKHMKELEDYVQELTEDIMEMIEGASPEEKQILRQKISTLSTKIK